MKLCHVVLCSHVESGHLLLNYILIFRKDFNCFRIMAVFGCETSIGVLPPLSDESFSWLSTYVTEKTNQKVSSIALNDLVGAGGLTADMKSLKVTLDDGTVLPLVCKRLGQSRTSMSKQMGLSREAFFYLELAPTLIDAGVHLPIVYFAHGDMSTGEKTIVMEDLSSDCIQAGYFFGPGSPLNWGKDLPALISNSDAVNKNVTLEDVSMQSFIAAAKMHAVYWKDKSLLRHSWLRGAQWVQQEGRDSWMAGQDLAANMWSKAKARIESGEISIKWSAHLVACMDASIAKVSWEGFQSDWSARAWTLVHGDFHPANMMWRAGKDGKSGYPLLLDWEVVGFGSGPQDIAQFLISHANPADRRLHENRLVREYYACLTGAAPQHWEGHRGEAKFVDAAEYPWEQCWADYVSGGTERWVWLFAYLTGLCPAAMNQYFHDQLAAFIEDHGVTPENIGMPRV